MRAGGGFLPSDEQDLVFYYSGEAQAAMGARSVMGAQIEACRRSELVHAKDPSPWMKRPAADKRVVLSDDAIAEEQIDAARRARAIAARLGRLDSESHTVLELHYQYTDLVSGEARVSVALCAATETAKVGYHRFVERATRAARPRTLGPMDNVLRHRHIPVRETDTTLELSIQTWIRWLATRKGATIAAGSVLEAIIEEARKALQKAQAAYAAAKGDRRDDKRDDSRAMYLRHG